MKISKILSAVCAAVMAVSTFAVPASADEVSYHAYIGVQSVSYTFRNAWDDATYGQGITSEDGMVYFDQLTGWEQPGNVAVKKDGVFTDAEITGDGTYSVSVTDFDFGEDETLNLLFVSTDIPVDAGITFSDVKVIMDGTTKYTFDEGYLDPDSKTYARPTCINIWNPDLGKEDGLFGYMMPTSSIEIQFTVTGTGVEAVTEATEAETEATTEESATEETTTEAAEEVTEATTEATEAETTTAADTEAAPADTEPAESSNTGLIIVIVVAAIAVVAVVVVLVVKKKN